ncbi:MAG: MBL fold metallo-hydrolase, partial [Rubricoccaceae bacterium]|nr:MBL fold metallo-hydrolase [Rubricoccaceae bacterium]
VPLGVEKHLTDEAQISVFDWHQYVDVGGLRIHCTPARHFSARTPWDRNQTLWASWYLEPLNDAAPAVYFAADSGYAPHFAEIRERLGAPEVVLMPIGAYRPRWMMRPVHVNPSEALQAFSDLGAGTLIPIHWGTYDLAEELLHEPPDVLLKEAEKTELRNAIEVLPVGGQLLFGEG